MKIKELLADPTNWTQGIYHRYKETAAKGEYMCSEEHPDTATAKQDPTNFCHCLYGALRVCYSDERERREAHHKLLTALGEIPLDLVGFNDNATHEEVLALVTKADV